MAVNARPKLDVPVRRPLQGCKAGVTIRGAVLCLVLACALAMAGCMSSTLFGGGPSGSGASSDTPGESGSAEALVNASTLASEDSERFDQTYAFLKALAADTASVPGKEGLPPYDGAASVMLNDDVPYFDARGALPYGNEFYSKLDMIGRCRTACAIVGRETMPAQHRSSIGDIRPSGWRISKYDWIDGKYLFNRCHLIGYQLTGQNANERNLITGTRYMNVEGMQPFENALADYVRKTGMHVLYRVTPVFDGVELVARGVVMEACSLEDGGAGMRFCRWCPNVQPGVKIDYLTGKNKLDEDNPVTIEPDGIEGGSIGSSESASNETGMMSDAEFDGGERDGSLEPEYNPDFDPSIEYDYILNKNSHLIHRPNCDKVAEMKAKNKRGFIGTREEVLQLAELEDYRLCRYCNP